MDTKDSSAAVGICRRGDSHDDPRSGSLSSSSGDSGGIAEGGGNVADGGMALSGMKKEFLHRIPQTLAHFIPNFPHQNVVISLGFFSREASV